MATARRQSLPVVTAQRRGTTDSPEGNYSSLSQYHAVSTTYCRLLALHVRITSRVSMVSRSGLFTSGRSSPNSEYSERIMFPRREYESESEPGPKRRAHRSRADHSDSEAEYKSRHFVTR